MRLRWWVLYSITVIAFSFSGLYYIITHFWPDPDTIFARPQLLFLTFVFFGIGAGTIPITAYLNHRFARPDWLKRDKARLLRQGVWGGFLGVLLAYLQWLRALNWTIVAVLVGVFVLIEIFFLTRE